ncbi:MAG: hypothetical protein DLM67_00820 [Candidatus Nephthysia bennettiae]|uniref:Uncharacterized protein n=1 Tax=Candidatus Nephthysia bennettiae TaxID=3127016 RepID=A0A934N6X1_9BACT|nr:hypothetical protein [Candidatus Dormibacteraeota bacterium]PZS00692.1 MAG: hypothetical protein DLM67_00820 [Candidatus Dormibacteraeota bacterium]
MATAHTEPPSEVGELTIDEGRELLDRYAQELLGMSGPEFLERYERGEFREAAQNGNRNVIILEMLLPFVR